MPDIRDITVPNKCLFVPLLMKKSKAMKRALKKHWKNKADNNSKSV